MHVRARPISKRFLIKYCTFTLEFWSVYETMVCFSSLLLILNSVIIGCVYPLDVEAECFFYPLLKVLELGA
jgi:hypothetical protein